MSRCNEEEQLLIPLSALYQRQHSLQSGCMERHQAQNDNLDTVKLSSQSAGLIIPEQAILQPNSHISSKTTKDDEIPIFTNIEAHECVESPSGATDCIQSPSCTSSDERRLMVRIAHPTWLWT